MRFYGLCSFPHGDYVLAGLLLSTIAAFCATAYAVTSCRFLNVSFRSDTGDLVEYFLHRQEADSGGRSPVLVYRAGVGLFQWLRPEDAVEDWTDGQCAGYSASMLDQLTDPMFETARVFGVLAVLMAVVVLLWTVSTACLAMNRVQIVLYTVCCVGGTVSSALTFLFTRSALCESLFLTRECKLDEGGLVMIVGSILWAIATAISVVYMRESDLGSLYEQDKEEELTPEQQGKLAGELARQKMVAKQSAAVAARAAKNGKTHPDDQRDWKKPISTVGDNADSEQQEHARPQTESITPPSRPYARTRSQDVVARRVQPTNQRPPARSSITVDDVTKNDTLEVYITPPRQRRQLQEEDRFHEV